MTSAALTGPACYCAAFARGLRPDPLQTIDEWADAHIQLPSYVAEPGQWRTSRTPFLREIMVCLSPSHPCQEVIFMKCVQIGGTQIATNWMGFIIARAPGAMLAFEPTKELAKKLSEEKFDPMVELSPALQGKVKDSRSRDSGNNIFRKKFLGGFLNFIGCNSAVGMRSTPARYVLVDEVDGCPLDVNGEGHPVDLAEKRTATFARRKIFLVSTPLEADTSRIEPEYAAGSRGRYHVPCPFCGHEQHLQWGQLVFTFDGAADPSRAAYRCAGCQALIPERYKEQMLALGRWIHDDPDNPVRSFHINALYQPYGWQLSWATLAREWCEATEKAKTGDVRQLKTFINTILAETWEENGEKADHSQLYQRREVYDAACPAGVLVLTAAVDLQDNRIEAEIVGWGVGEESWSIEYRVFPGSPAQPQAWSDLTEWLSRPRAHALGIALRVECVVVDTGGHHTKEAYWYVRRYRGRCYALKGSNQQGSPLVPPRPTTPHGASVHLYHVGTVAAKDTIFPRLALADPGPGYCHFPLAKEYDEEYFQQLAGEEKRNKYDRGVLVGYYYKKIRARNEALDLKVYNLAAVALLNPNWEALANNMMPPAQMELPPSPAPRDPWAQRTPPRVPAPVESASGRPRQPGRGGWMNRR
jgi:phage terminase large subunit GpA-like protein